MELDLSYFEKFTRSEWPEYESWIRRYQEISPKIWYTQRNKSFSFKNPPFISVVTPIYNTPPSFLFECIFSVWAQSYPFWEMCLVDDGTTKIETLFILRALVKMDKRFRLKRLPRNRGIAFALNEGVNMVRGDYIAFLDHDDLLHPEALYQVACYLRKYPETDILYSDRDEISPQGLRFRHLFKPDWAPETILSTIYLFHLTVWRKKTLDRLSEKKFLKKRGPFRPEFEGSQDYDLLLRAAEKNVVIKHIPLVLYHWRHHPGSLAMSEEAKVYTFEAARKALAQALERRKIPAQPEEISWLWRGNFRLRFKRPPKGGALVFNWSKKETFNLKKIFKEALDSQAEFLVFLGPGVQPLSEESTKELINWFHIPEVAITTGKLVTPDGKLWHAGLVFKENGEVLPVYRGFPENEPGYMSVTAVARNVSLPHPYCLAIRRQALDRSMITEVLNGPHLFFDLALKILSKGLRIVYNPFARFIIDPPEEIFLPQEKDIFRNLNQKTLEDGDPYYSPHLTLERNDMGLKF